MYCTYFTHTQYTPIPLTHPINPIYTLYTPYKPHIHPINPTYTLYTPYTNSVYSHLTEREILEMESIIGTLGDLESCDLLDVDFAALEEAYALSVGIPPATVSSDLFDSCTPFIAEDGRNTFVTIVRYTITLQLVL